jgi:hypothetical protein
MPLKTLKWYEAEFLNACGLAGLYGCELSVDQFCACRGLEPEDREMLVEYLHRHSIAL